MNVSKTLLIEPHLLGSLEYFTLINKYDTIYWEVHDHFVRQTFRNRYYIQTSHGIRSLTIPAIFNNRTPFKDVKIDHSQSWQRDHNGAIQAAYGKAPFFEFFIEEFKKVWESEPTYMLDMCYKMMTICQRILQIDIKILETKDYSTEPENGIEDHRDTISIKEGYESRQYYKPFNYLQNFGNNFAPNLSIIDCIFSTGQETGGIIKKSMMNE